MNNQIVYIVKYTDIIVYIGSGTPTRPKHATSGVSHCYALNKLHFEGKIVDIEIAAQGLTTEQARAEEARLIQELKPEGNIDGLELSGVEKFLRGSTQCFSQTMKEYCIARDTGDTETVDKVDGKDTYFQNLYNHLGSVKLKALEYRRKDIDAAYQIAKKIVLAQATKTVASITNYQVGDTILKSEIKLALQAAYDELGVTKKAKASDLADFYNIKEARINRTQPAFRII